MSDNFNVLTITTPDVENGTGCRVTIWAAGCQHYCEGCHNKHAWSYNQGKKLLDIKENIFTAADKPYIQGVTFSGGDPLFQSPNALCDLIDFIKEFKERFPDKDIWIYSGFTFEEIMDAFTKKMIIENCDVLVDGKFDLALKDPDLPFKGSKNQRIIDIKKTIEKQKIITLF